MWSGAEPYAIGVAYNLAYFLAMLAALISVRLVTGGGLWRLGLRLKCGQLYAYAFPVFINTLLYMIVGWTDIFVVGLYLDAAEIGRYRACMQLVVVFDLIAVALGSAIIHRYAVLEEQGRVAEAAVLYRHNIRWVVALAAPLTVIIIAHAVPILGMMGASFVAAKPVLILLTLAYMIKSIGTSPGMALVVTRRQGVETRIAALVAGINLALNFLLVPEFGASGAAFATVISFVCLTLMRACAARRYARLEYPYAMAMRLIVAFLVPGCLVFWWLPRLFEIGALFHTLLLLTVLSVFAWRFALNGDERKWLAGTLWRISR
jgi:O-antigen/teichoic acid export membrane protein